MKKTELAAAVTAELKKIYPDAVCALEYASDPWKLLVMARLSAQCTDKRVNAVSPALFERFPDACSMAEADVTEIEALVRSCGLYHTKAGDIKEMSRQLVSDCGGIVPDELDELLKLRGVGRKIANLIVGDVYGKPAVVTDTHCIRICGRLGFYPETLKDPPKIEKILASVIEPAEQSDFCHRIVSFGRDVCTARSPACEGCPLNKMCKKYGNEHKGKTK